jgi:hypothetical protein
MMVGHGRTTNEAKVKVTKALPTSTNLVKQGPIYLNYKLILQTDGSIHGLKLYFGGKTLDMTCVYVHAHHAH